MDPGVGRGREYFASQVRRPRLRMRYGVLVGVWVEGGERDGGGQGRMDGLHTVCSTSPTSMATAPPPLPPRWRHRLRWAAVAAAAANVEL